ncbi:D-beta-hydroxybutyrate dehydrogenase, mitochondrial-like [Glandiceps talaboti]
MASVKIYILVLCVFASLPFLLPLPVSCITTKVGLSFLTVTATILFLWLSPTRGRITVDNKAVLITGCDSGFGLALAKHLYSLGFEVFAGCLLKDKGGAGAKELEGIDKERLTVLQLDVASDRQVNNAVKAVKWTLARSHRVLWGVVNNAGVSSFGEIEWCAIEKYRFVYDINVLGMIRVTKAFLPLIRGSKGRVVNMASGISRQAVPSRSLYCTSKFAVQGFSDCLRYEMHRWGVHVSILEPGNFIAATGIFNESLVDKTSKEMWDGMSEEVKRDYGKDYFDKTVNTMKSYSSTSEGSTSMAPVIDAYTDALVSRTPRIRYYPMQLYWHVRRVVFTHLPECVADALYHGIYY